jgi:hypothetical protein
MEHCEKCGQFIVRSQYYDPDGLIPLVGGKKEYKDDKLIEWWVCINNGCPDGKINTKGN